MKNNYGVMRERIFNVISAHIQKYGYSPSVRDIGAEVGLSSPDTVQYHINRLVSEGKISRNTWDKTRSRTIRLKRQQMMNLRADLKTQVEVA